MKNCNSVSEFATDYDAFILDIWGVIHDGITAYPDVVECLQNLESANKKILFLSNAPRRAYKVKKALAKFGVTENLYLSAISSGEVAFAEIQNYIPNLKNYFYIGPKKDKDLLDGLDLTETSAEEADFAIATGFDKDNSTLDEKLPQIVEALKNKLKLYCVNPDKLVVRQDGSFALCAGVIGEYYALKGGEAIFIGKPYKQVYAECFKILKGIPKQKIAAIGDNLDTDILGANQAGIDSILCLGGILKAEKKPYLQLVEESGICPKITIPRFCW